MPIGYRLSGTATGSGAGLVLVVPGLAELAILCALAKAGDMKALSEKAIALSAQDLRYRPFAKQLSELALGYQSKAALRLVEMHTTKKQAEQVGQS